MRTQGGLGNWIDFHADGTVEVGSGALVGALLDDTYTGQTAFETFTPSGKWYLRVPMGLRHGRHTVTPAAVIVQSAQQSDTFTRDGDALRWGTADGKHSTYRRAPE